MLHAAALHLFSFENVAAGESRAKVGGCARATTQLLFHLLLPPLPSLLHSPLHHAHTIHTRISALSTMTSRAASHAGSWYSDDQAELDAQLSSWLGSVDTTQIPPAGVSAADQEAEGEEDLKLPIDRVKAVIAP